MGKSKETGDKEKTEKADQTLIISRASWGALPAPPAKVQLETPIKEVVYTDTDTKTCSTKQECTRIVKELQKYHIDLKGLADIEYNFLIGGDGNVYEGRGWHTASPANEKETSEGKDTSEENNEQNLEIAFIGTFKGGDIPPEMKKAVEGLMYYGIQNELVSPDGAETDDDPDEEKKKPDFPKPIVKGVKKFLSYGVEKKLLSKKKSEYEDDVEPNYNESEKRFFDDIVKSKKKSKHKFKRPFVDITQMDVEKATESEVEEAEMRADDRGLFTIECR